MNKLNDRIWRAQRNNVVNQKQVLNVVNVYDIISNGKTPQEQIAEQSYPYSPVQRVTQRRGAAKSKTGLNDTGRICNNVVYV